MPELPIVERTVAAEEFRLPTGQWGGSFGRQRFVEVNSQSWSIQRSDIPFLEFQLSRKQIGRVGTRRAWHFLNTYVRGSHA